MIFFRWYPPGHGDFYHSFHNSGLMDDLIAQGRKYVFLSNIDNLGAMVDFNILSECIREQSDFIMEVTDKTRADVKGGTLIQYDGHLRLLEVAQVPKDHLEDFKSVKKFNVFNTNNLWLRLESIKDAVSQNTLDMEVIGKHILLARFHDFLNFFFFFSQSENPGRWSECDPVGNCGWCGHEVFLQLPRDQRPEVEVLAGQEVVRLAPDHEQPLRSGSRQFGDVPRAYVPDNSPCQARRSKLQKSNLFRLVSLNWTLFANLRRSTSSCTVSRRSRTSWS